MSTHVAICHPVKILRRRPCLWTVQCGI